MYMAFVDHEKIAAFLVVQYPSSHDSYVASKNLNENLSLIKVTKKNLQSGYIHPP
jgi:hypothetical protein